MSVPSADELTRRIASALAEVGFELPVNLCVLSEPAWREGWWTPRRETHWALALYDRFCEGWPCVAFDLNMVIPTVRDLELIHRAYRLAYELRGAE